MSFHKPANYSNYRRDRKRKIPLIRSFLLIFVLIVAWKMFQDIPDPPERPEMHNASLVPQFVPVPALVNLPQDNLLTHIVKPGDTFSGILTKCEVASEWSTDILRSLKPLGLSVLFPGDSLVVKKDSGGQLKELELLSKLKCRYQVFFSDSVVKAKKCSLAVHSYICMANGVLETSLSDQMYKMGVSDVMTGKFADIFAWDINFFIDPRKGDTFQIIFEQKFAEGRFAGYGDILAARYVNNGKQFSAFGFRDDFGQIRYYDENGKALQKQFLKAPLNFSRISSVFTLKRKHPILGIVRPHLGIDYAAPTGTPVCASADGRVTFAGKMGGYGNLIILSHGGVYETQYGHLQKINSKIRTGAHISQGEVIGTVGSTGLSTGPHLDYRMKRHGQFVNPSAISTPSGKEVEAAKFAEYQNVKQSHFAALELRFSKLPGLHIIDIESKASEEPVVHQISRVK